jgi:hypothetical protein
MPIDDDNEGNAVDETMQRDSQVMCACVICTHVLTFVCTSCGVLLTHRYRCVCTTTTTTTTTTMMMMRRLTRSR